MEQNGVIAYLTPTSFLGGQYFKALRKILTDDATPAAFDFIADRDGGDGLFPQWIADAPSLAGLDNLHQLIQGIQTARKTGISIELNEHLLGFIHRQPRIQTPIEGIS